MNAPGRELKSGSPPPLPKKSKRVLIVVTGILALVLVPMLVLVVWYASLRASNTSAIRKLESEIRQRGEPLTLVELQAHYPLVLDAENAAIPLMALWEKEDPSFWQAFRKGERPLPSRATKDYPPALPILGREAGRLPRGMPLPQASIEAANAFLLENTEYLEGVRAAMRRPHFRFPVQITNGQAALLPHLTSLKQQAQCFRLATVVAADRGETDSALAALKDAAKTGQLLTDEPILISQLVRLACLRMAMDGVEDLLSRRTLTALQLEVLKAFLESLETGDTLRRTLVDERVFALSAFDAKSMAPALADISSDGDSDPMTPEQYGTGLAVMKAVGLLAADHRLMLETFGEAISSTGDEMPESLDKYDRAFAVADEKAHAFPPKIFSMLFLPATSRVAAKFALHETHRRAALCAVAVERHRLQHDGQLPETLGDLVPALLSRVPLDPFDGQPLRYRKLEKGYEVYSIGNDRNDDGGKERPMRGPVKDYDETFIVER